jgi:hypothetical protein
MIDKDSFFIGADLEVPTAQIALLRDFEMLLNGQIPKYKEMSKKLGDEDKLFEEVVVQYFKDRLTAINKDMERAKTLNTNEEIKAMSKLYWKERFGVDI